jgi:sirohydrochlorin ferrochelatase
MSEPANAPIDPHAAVLRAISATESGEMSPPQANAVASLARASKATERPEADDGGALIEVARRARLMAGLPPETPEEWAWAERTLTEEAVAEFRRWAARPRGAAYWDAAVPVAVGEGVAEG